MAEVKPHDTAGIAQMLHEAVCDPAGDACAWNAEEGPFNRCKTDEGHYRDTGLEVAIAAFVRARFEGLPVWVVPEGYAGGRSQGPDGLHATRMVRLDHLREAFGG